jgi:signal transduction histidine kinase
MEKLNHPLDILHIEDNPDDAFFFRNHLHAVDIEIGRIVQLESLAGALDYLNNGGAPDLIFLDLSLPDAWELDGLTKILASDPSLVVIVLTGSGDRSLPLRALQAGAQDYMSKQELSAEMLARIIRFAIYRTESQQILLAASEEAKRANIAKSRFLANIGHELRTPLNVMMGYTDLFAAEVSTFPDVEQKHVKEDLHAVTTAQEHLLDLLNDLIDMAKIESDQLRLEPSVFSLLQLVENISSLFRESMENNGNVFTVDFDDSVPELIYADPKRIRQLLINLISNANKFTRSGTIKLLIRCDEDPQGPEDHRELTIQVSDTGIGIAEEHQEAIFEYFSQVDDSDRREFEGSGLGLTICRQLANMMGGDITVESDLGEGACFTVKSSGDALRIPRR